MESGRVGICNEHSSETKSNEENMDKSICSSWNVSNSGCSDIRIESPETREFKNVTNNDEMQGDSTRFHDICIDNWNVPGCFNTPVKYRMETKSFTDRRGNEEEQINDHNIIFYPKSEICVNLRNEPIKTESEYLDDIKIITKTDSDSLLNDRKLKNKMQSDNANILVFNSALSLLQDYFDSSEDEKSNSSMPVNSITHNRQFSETSSDSDSEKISSIKMPSKVSLEPPPRTRGEIFPEELPPIENLSISVPPEECLPIGEINSIVGVLVLISSFPGTPALNLDSVLFLEEGKKALGKIFDVVGSVRQPFYVIRFNSADEINNHNLNIGLKVYYAPRTNYASYVFLEQLCNVKGSDASWEDNNEPPEHCLDYSDDDEEVKARRKLLMNISRKRHINEIC